jgi:hypothetical protein
MLASLITSKTRIKLLIRLFLNPDTKGHLRGLAEEFKESTNSVRLELNRFEEAGMLLSKAKGNKKVYNANTEHPLYPEIQKILRKVTGIDEVLQRVTKRLGGLKKVYLTGQMADGSDSELIDLILVGGHIDQNYLIVLSTKAEKLIHRKIRTLCILPDELEIWKSKWTQKLLLLWSSEVD